MLRDLIERHLTAGRDVATQQEAAGTGEDGDPGTGSAQIMEQLLSDKIAYRHVSKQLQHCYFELIQGGRRVPADLNSRTQQALLASYLKIATIHSMR